MRTIICGSRKLTDKTLVEKAVQASGFTITEVVSGKAKGGDRLGEEWAKSKGIKITPFPADWKNLTAKGAVVVKGPYGPYNKLAGLQRNEEMAAYAEQVIALNEDTDGTAHMIKTAYDKGLKVFIYREGTEQVDF